MNVCRPLLCLPSHPMPRIPPPTGPLVSLATPRQVPLQQLARFSAATCLRHPRASSEKPSTGSKPSLRAPLTAPTTSPRTLQRSQATSPPTLRPEGAPAASSPDARTLQLPPPKYHVSRSANKNLPIYTDYKRGGNLHLTTIRKVAGDLTALRDELRVFLSKKNDEVKINSLTQHVIVKVSPIFRPPRAWRAC